MRRYFPILVGLALLMAGGVVHGVLTDRWQHAPELDRAVAALGSLPGTLGDWESQEVEQETETLAQAGALGCWSRRFTNRESGESILVILLAGRAGQMSVHRPEHCYQSAGYEMAGEAVHGDVKVGSEAKAELWTALFHKEESEGPIQLRIFWTWLAGSNWQAPSNPRWVFARQRVLYKLYLIRPVSGRANLAQDPCLPFLGLLLPVLNRHLVVQS